MRVDGARDRRWLGEHLCRGSGALIIVERDSEWPDVRRIRMLFGVHNLNPD
jgi:hypothetical protein